MLCSIVQEDIGPKPNDLEVIINKSLKTDYYQLSVNSYQVINYKFIQNHFIDIRSSNYQEKKIIKWPVCILLNCLVWVLKFLHWNTKIRVTNFLVYTMLYVIFGSCLSQIKKKPNIYIYIFFI